MTEISDAAKRKALDLANARTGPRWDMRDAASPNSLVNVIACVLQEHSDVAKDVQRDLCSRGLGCPPELQSLTLPDEPCAMDKFAKWLNGCSKDGKKLQEAAALFGLKIVEADSHE